MAVKSSPPAPSPTGEGVSGSLASGAAPKGRHVNNPVRKRGVQNGHPCFSRGILSVPSGKPVHRASAGQGIVHPRAAFRFAALARGYSRGAPAGLLRIMNYELRIKNWLTPHKNWLTPQLEINKK